MGGGKSFTAVSRMIDHIADGGVVYSNIELKLNPWFNPDYLMKEFILPEQYAEPKMDLTVSPPVPVFVDSKEGRGFVYNSRGARFFLSRFKNWHYQEGQFNYIPDDAVGPDLMKSLPSGSVDRPVLVILDEALDHFESCSSNVNAEFRSFLRHVRKLGINLIFIAQDFGAMEKKIRMLVHYVWLFKDLKTWPVPCIGSAFSALRWLGGNKPSSALPPPFCDNIHTRQYHQKTFGMASAEIINRQQYVYRDPFIFQCYQSVNLHNSNIQMKGKAQDFGESGRIKKEKSKVKPFERVLIYALLLVSVYMSFRRPAAVPVASVSSPPPVAVSNISRPAAVSPGVPPELPKERVTMFINSKDRVQVGTVCDGRSRIYRLGGYVGGRQVVALSDSSVTLKDDRGDTETLRF